MSYTNYYPSSNMLHASLSKIMGTQLDVLLLGKDEAELRFVWADMEHEVIRLDRSLNRFDKYSDISTINLNAAVRPVSTTKEIFDIIEDCRRYYHLTEGYFDISIGNFGDIILDSEKETVFFSRPGIEIDLGGYAKGYVLEIFRSILDRNGLECAFVNFGNSSVLALGSHPYGEYWPVGLENPYSGAKIKELKLRNCSLSVSGNMPSHPKHIVNPFNGEFVEERKLVAVESLNSVDAEVLTTTLMIKDDKDYADRILRNFEIENIYSYIL